MFVLGTKSKRTFRIIEQEESKVQKILDMNKNAKEIADNYEESDIDQEEE